MIDILPYSHHLPAWYCIDIARRNSVLVTCGSERVKHLASKLLYIKKKAAFAEKSKRTLFYAKGPFNRFQHLTNIRSTKVERMLGKCWNCLNRPFNIFENKGKIESMLNESLNRFKLDSTRFQQAFNIFYVFNNVGRPVQTHRIFGSTKCWMHVQANVETALAQRLFRIRYETRAVGTAKINWLIDLIQLIYVNI